jgi:hypothetical protein
MEAKVAKIISELESNADSKLRDVGAKLRELYAMAPFTAYELRDIAKQMLIEARAKEAKTTT